ncbi:MAG: hydantoinase/oxoprolinase family protein, partial [Burkholderiales bacterium]|nr:hydantoinase/oxoprolinase family protein [Burkholderiales bacterium]
MGTGMRIGIDVGGTFTDFILTRDGAPPLLHKVLSTPDDPSVAVVDGLHELAALCGTPPQAFVAAIGTIVHGTTVATNATLTHTGARSALLTTHGVRDALEMRRGVREKQYDNTYTNVAPLVPRHLRIGLAGRLDRAGAEVEPPDFAQVDAALAQLRSEGVEAVAICFMHAWANPAHEEAVAARVREALPGAFLSVSSTLLPSIRFYDRVSTTALDAYVGPKLNRYVERLVERLAAAGFRGSLLIMQSNGGVMSPQVARASPARTLLAGPAGGPAAGRARAQARGRRGA